MLRDHSCVNSWMVGLNDVKSYKTAKGFVKYNICAHYGTVKGASVKKALHSLLDGKIMNSVMSWTQHPTEVTNHLHDL